MSLNVYNILEKTFVLQRKQDILAIFLQIDNSRLLLQEKILHNYEQDIILYYVYGLLKLIEPP